MKKIISIVILISCVLSLFGCSDENKNEESEVYLDLNNYSHYLTIEAKCYGTDAKKVYDSNGGYYSYQNIAYSVNVTPASESLIFTDAVAIVKIYCEYQYLRDDDYRKEHSETVSVKLNIGGSGSEILNKPTATDEDVLLHAFGAYDVTGLYYDVVEISGRVRLS